MRRIGVVGAGTISRTLHLPVLTSMPDVRIEFLADANDARAASVARAFEVPHLPIDAVDDAVTSCDVVLLAIPVGVRARYLEVMSRAGVAAFVEKPFARTVAEHTGLLELFPVHRLVCGFMRRTYASTTVARTALRGGWFGRPRRIRVFEGARTTKTGVDRSYLDDPHAGGGVLLEIGCHALDLVIHLTGAVAHKVVSQHVLFDGHGDRRAAGELLLFTQTASRDTPIPVDYQFSWLDGHEDYIEFEFRSVRMRLGVRPETPAILLGLEDDEHEARVMAPSDAATTSNQAFYLEWRWTLEALRTGVASPLAASTCLGVTGLIEDIYAAARRSS